MIRICAGFDGSQTDDWTAVKAETVDGLLFTPTYGPGKRPMIWNPGDFGGRIPKAEVHAAMESLFAEFEVERLYCDPPYWQTEVEVDWPLAYGDKIVLPWWTMRVTQMHPALERFVTDLISGRLKHDGCEITSRHVANARKLLRPGDKYLIVKPQGAYHQKIDAAVASVLAHEAACDARAAGWAATSENYVYY